MGSWDESCDLSGLPLKSGDKTVAVAICNSPNEYDTFYKDSVSVCYPVSFAMRGEYNDYGGIDRVEKNVTTKVLANEVLEADDYDGLADNPDHLASLLSDRMLTLGKDEIEAKPSLFLIREDVYEHLLTDKYAEEWTYDKHADSYLELVEDDAQRFLEYMDDVFDNPESHRLIFRPDDVEDMDYDYVKVMEKMYEQSSGYNFLKWTDFDSRNFCADGRNINAFHSTFAHRREAEWGNVSKALRMYSKWLFDVYSEGKRSDDPEVQQFVKEAIEFKMLTKNMYLLSLDWIPKDGGVQTKERQPYEDWHSMCLEKVGEIE